MKHSQKRECLRHLRDTFGLSSFRPGQKAAVHALLSGRDVMCILPTGSGKSLCWQLPALVHEGLTVVVSPLIALMRDQVEHLVSLEISAVSLDSLMLPEARETAMQQIRTGEARIVFVSPERLMQTGFRRLCEEMKPWLVVVDEAHCIVQWGGSFRPAYAAIGEFLTRLPLRPVLCSLTATADDAMQQAIQESLGMRRIKQIVLPIVRENLIYEVCTTLDSTSEILRLIHRKTCKTLIFCRSRFRTEWLASKLSGMGVSAAAYHAGMSREDRLDVQGRFASGDVQVMCATTAFGMGVDVPDIRRIIHDEMPDGVIDYIQQSGRAGRDGEKAECILLLEPLHLTLRADLRRRLKDETVGNPFRRWFRVRKKRRQLRQLLQSVLSSECIPAAMSHVFGQSSSRCGICSACRRGRLLPGVPDIGGMKEWQVRAFVLQWQRNSLANQRQCIPSEILSDAALNDAARKLVFPDETSAPQEMERLLAHFRRERMYDSASKRI